MKELRQKKAAEEMANRLIAMFENSQQALDRLMGRHRLSKEAHSLLNHALRLELLRGNLTVAREIAATIAHGNLKLGT